MSDRVKAGNIPRTILLVVDGDDKGTVRLIHDYSGQGAPSYELHQGVFRGSTAAPCICGQWHVYDPSSGHMTDSQWRHYP